MEQAHNFNWQLRVFLFILLGIGVLIAFGVIAISSEPFYADASNPEVSSEEVEEQYTQEPLYYKVSQIPSSTEPSETQMLLFFSETWDSHSTRMEEILETLYTGGLWLPVVKIDISENRQLATEYEVSSPSTLVLVDYDGQEISRVNEVSRDDIDELILLAE